MPFMENANGDIVSIGCHAYEGERSVEGDTILDFQTFAVDAQL